MPKRLPLIPLEKAQIAAEKKQRIADAKRSAREDGWRLVDKTKECFYPNADGLPLDERTSNQSSKSLDIPSRGMKNSYASQEKTATFDL